MELVEISDDSEELDRGRRMTTFENVVIADELGLGHRNHGCLQ